MVARAASGRARPLPAVVRAWLFPALAIAIRIDAAGRRARHLVCPAIVEAPAFRGIVVHVALALALAPALAFILRFETGLVF